MHIDAHTSLLFSASIMGAISIFIGIYAVSRRENRTFLWLSAAAACLGVAYILVDLRGQIPDFFSILLSNELVLVCFIAFYEVIRRFLSTDLKVNWIGVGLLAAQLALLAWFTYVRPDFGARVLVFNITMGTMCLLTLRLIMESRSKANRFFHIFLAIPFGLLFCASAARIALCLSGSPLMETSLQSESYGLSLLIYCILLVWISFSIVFISASTLQNTLADIALSDALTGVLNLRGLSEAILREISRSRRAGGTSSIILADFDHFKKINDDFGHQAGDAVLIHTTALFRSSIRAEDLMGRYGGEEFVLLLPGVNEDGACVVAERLRALCKETPVVYRNQPIPVTCSFGIAQFKDGVPDYDTLIRRADNALYRAKAGGRDQVVRFSQPAAG